MEVKFQPKTIDPSHYHILKGMQNTVFKVSLNICHQSIFPSELYILEF